MRVLGLDPGLSCAGYGVIERAEGGLRALVHGAIRTPKTDVGDRLRLLRDELSAVVEAYKPDAVSVERVFFNANTRTAMSVGQAAGIALLVAADAGCEIGQYSPNEVKATVTGYGAADKAQVQQMVARLLSLDAIPKPADAADALALAITHLHARKLRMLEADSA